MNYLDKTISGKNNTDFLSHYLFYLNYSALGLTDKSAQQAFFIGKKARDIGKTDMAIEFFRKIEKNTNSMPDIYWLIGSLYDDKNDYTNAVNYYKKYISSSQL